MQDNTKNLNADTIYKLNKLIQKKLIASKSIYTTRGIIFFI